MVFKLFAIFRRNFGNIIAHSSQTETSFTKERTMKKLVYTAATIISFIALTSMTLLQMGEFKFESESHDFGTIPFNKPASHEFVFTNVGKAPIIISEVAPSCGCSVADYSKSPVKPGESGKIKVTYNAAAKGPFTKSFVVKSNTKTPVKTLTIKGNVE